MRRFVLVVALCLATACGSTQSDTSASTTTSTSTTTTSTTPTTTTTVDAPSTTAETTTTLFDPTLELLSLTQARQRWTDSAPLTYQWTYQMVCECDPGPWTILIENGDPLEIVNDSQLGTEPPFISVDHLFDEIEAVLEEGRIPVRVNYDDANGVPSVYVFNEPELPVDGGFIFELEHYEPDPPVDIDYPETCSTEGWDVALVVQDLPDVVAQTRQEIFDAAMSCDFEALRQLSRAGLPNWTFQTTFGGEGVELFWQEEARGEPILQDVVNHFNQPVAADGEFYIWPSAFVTLEAADGTGMDPDSYAQLLELYTVEELQDMIDFAQGYVGWRTTITAEGVWTVFIAGD